ncbi:MAG: T9SS type A sorting domain-containing protein [Bacteroidia bacterium]
MKKIILLIVICGMIGGNVKGQNVEKNTAVNFTCPSVYVINPDTTIYLYFDTISNFHSGGCYVSWCGENIIRFTAQCTNNYILEMISPWGNVWFPVSYKISTLTNCDSTGYTCLIPFSSVWNNQQQLYYDKFYISATNGFTYDILIDYACANPTSDPPQTLTFLLSKPHVSNVQFYDITPDSISVSWDGTFDDMVIEHGLKGFIPGNDTLSGINGTIIHNPVSPYTFYGLTPDSVYDFYFRDKCGTYSANSTVNRKRIPNPANISSLNCNTFFGFLYNANPIIEGAWSMNSCGTLVHEAIEKLYTFTPDTTGIYSLHHGPGSLSQLEIGIYYKDSLLGFNEHNWICAGHGTNTAIWDASFGPLTSGTTYLIMFKTNHLYGAYLTLGFNFNCPSPICSSAPTSINPNATNNTICSNQSVTLTQIGGVLSTTGLFRWYADSCGGTIIANGYSPTFSPTDTTTYYVRAEDTCGVTACASVTINVNLPLPPPTITGITSICQGGSTTLNAGSGYSCYLWATGATTQTINVSSAVTSIYTVTVCNASGCTASGNITVTVNPLPVPFITGSLVICPGGSTFLDAGWGFTNYLWSLPGGIVASSQGVVADTAGIYTVYVTNAFGCTNSVSVTVTSVPNPVAIITPPASSAICAGDTVHFMVNTATGYTYQWYHYAAPIAGATNSFYNATANGFYKVELTDSNLCTDFSASYAVIIVCPPPIGDPQRITSGSGIEIIIVPNPATDEITIFNLPAEAAAPIKIYTVLGIELFSQQATDNPDKYGAGRQLTIDISNFSKGIYFVSIDNGKEKVLKKFVKE